MVTNVNILSPNPEMTPDVAMMYIPVEMFEDNPVVLPYSFVSNNRYIGGFVGKLSETAINIPWLFFDVGCGIQIAVIEGEEDSNFKEVIKSILSETYVSKEIEDLLGSEIMNYESPYNIDEFDISPVLESAEPHAMAITLPSGFTTYTQNLYCIDYTCFENYVPDYNLVSTVSTLTTTPHFAISFHKPCPITTKVFWYYLEKYADEGNYVRDAEAIQEMIQAHKLCVRYAKEQRDYYTKRLQDCGYNVIMSFDSPHIFVDDENIFHWEAQSAKVDDVSIRIYGSNIYLFNGLGNEDWKNSVCGSTIFDKSSAYTFNLIDYVNVVSPSAELITNFVISSTDDVV